jgi:lysozyme family protein
MIQMSNFADSISIVLKHEGGYVNNPADPGGETKFGISKAAHPEVDIAILTEEKAKDIYRTKYWEPNKLGELTNQKIANAVLDAIVNHGKGAFIVQKALIASGYELNADNAIGPITRYALNSVNEKIFLKNYVATRKAYYDALIDKDPALQVFKKGWYKRADFFLPTNVALTGTMIAGLAIVAYFMLKSKKR